MQSTHGFDGVQKRNYFRRGPNTRIEMKLRVRKLKNGKTAGKDKVMVT